MSYLYNFGLSQEDERSEARALDLRPADRVLSIVSAGEMPLSLGSGAIWAGRFEQYLARITRYAIPLLGRRRVTGIFECRTLAEQEAYFDSRLDLRAIRLLLRVAFNRKVYASRGMDPRSLRYRTSQDEPLGVQFYRQFRNALTRTPAQENYLMQLILPGSVRSDECVPAYLTASGYQIVRRNRDRIEIREASGACGRQRSTRRSPSRGADRRSS
jgi:Protein of unknown function (DUF3419)